MRTPQKVASLLAILLFLPIAFEFTSRYFSNGEGVRRIDHAMSAVLGMLGEYRKEFGSFPAGDTATICQALLGRNPHGKKFLSWEPKNINSAGEFVDPWGTPYRIYISGEYPLIRSAGENRTFEPSITRRGDDYFGG